MAFPTVRSIATSSEASNVTSHDVTMPSGLTSGDLIVICWATDGSGSSSFEIPAGWARPFTDELNSGGNNAGVRYKIADGTEGASVAFSTSSSETSAHITLAITAGTFDTSALLVGGKAELTNANPNPPSLDPTEGAGGSDYLWIAGFGCDNEETVSGWPTNYTDNQTYQAAGNATQGCATAIATRSFANSGAEDPSLFTMSASENWLAYTLAVHPAGGTTYTKAGGATAPFTGSGADVDTAVETGAGVSPHTASGADAFTAAETGAGVAPFTGSGADVHTAAETGAGVIGFTGGGAGTLASGTTYEKAGLAAAPFTGSGADVFEATETGAAVTAFTGGGARSVTHERANLAVVPFTGAGADAHTAVETGAAILERVGSGADAFTATETGAAILAFTGGGVSALNEISLEFTAAACDTATLTEATCDTGTLTAAASDSGTLIAA